MEFVKEREREKERELMILTCSSGFDRYARFRVSHEMEVLRTKTRQMHTLDGNAIKSHGHRILLRRPAGATSGGGERIRSERSSEDGGVLLPTRGRGERGREKKRKEEKKRARTRVKYYPGEEK